LPSFADEMLPHQSGRLAVGLIGHGPVGSPMILIAVNVTNVD
jgi:hypothetical protein